MNGHYEKHNTQKKNSTDGSRPGGYKYIKVCGNGAYGVVWLVRDEHNTLLVLKQILKTGASEREISGLLTYSRLREKHPNLIDIVSSGEDGNSFFYTMPPADNLKDSEEEYLPATLENVLKTRKLSPGEVRNISLQLLDALELLHRNGLVHRDIKPANILFINKKPCFCDIGLVGSATTRASLVGTLGFLPPELLKKENVPLYGDNYKKEYDVYAFGKVMYCMLTGLPVDNFPIYSPDRTDRLSSGLNRIILKLCEQNPAWRLSSITKIRSLLQMAGGNSWIKFYGGTGIYSDGPVRSVLMLSLGAAVLAGSCFLCCSVLPSATVRRVARPPSVKTETVKTVRNDPLKNKMKNPAKYDSEWYAAVSVLDYDRMKALLEKGYPPDRVSAATPVPAISQCLKKFADVKFFKLLTDYGVKLRPYPPDNKSLLQQILIMKAPLSIISVLKKAEKGKVYLDTAGRDDIYYAMIAQNDEALRYLVAEGEPVDRKDFYGRTALSEAVKHGHESIANLLLELGASPSTVNNMGMTPLHMLSRPCIEMIDVLTAKGADINAAANNEKVTPLLSATQRNLSTEYISRLVEKGADPCALDIYRITSLHNAVSCGNMETVRFLLGTKINVNARDITGRTPLHYAAIYGRLEMIPVLLGAGAKVNAVDKYGRSPLTFAYIHENRDVIKCLEDAGGKAYFPESSGLRISGGKIRNRDGKTIDEYLTGSSWRDKLQTVPKKIMSGSMCCPEERLCSAIITNNPARIGSLIEREKTGANSPDWQWERPLSLALIHTCEIGTFAELLAFGANPLFGTRKQIPILEEAMKYKKSLPLLRLLVEYGGDPYAVYRFGISPMDYAISEGRSDVAALFEFYCGKH